MIIQRRSSILRYRRNEGKRPRGFRGQNTRRQQPVVDAYLSLDISRFLRSLSLSFFLAFLYLCFSFLLFLLSPRSYPYFSDDDDNDDSFRRRPKPLVQFCSLALRAPFRKRWQRIVCRVTSFFLYLRTFSLSLSLCFFFDFSMSYVVCRAIRSSAELTPA